MFEGRIIKRKLERDDDDRRREQTYVRVLLDQHVRDVDLLERISVSEDVLVSPRISYLRRRKSEKYEKKRVAQNQDGQRREGEKNVKRRGMHE